MLVFSTMLDINETMTREAFVRLVIDWNQGSPHSNNVIRGIDWNGEKAARYEDDRRWLEIVEYHDIIAIRYERTDDNGAVWDTDFVMNFDEMRMSIQLGRSFRDDALEVGADFVAPHFVALLIDGGYVKNDGDLPVTRTPLWVAEQELQTVAGIVSGEIRYRYPVVYISKTFANQDPVNTRKLAGGLKGVAHVLVQQSGTTSNALRELCCSKNPFNGAIGIYYPNAAVGNRLYLYHREEGFDELLYSKVVRDVIRYHNTLYLDALYTWQGVNNALLADKLIGQRQARMEAERAKKNAETEVLDVYAAFDAEIQSLEQQVDSLAREVEALRAENYGLRNKLTETDAMPVLFAGEEDEFFHGEIREIILAALKFALQNNTTDKTRRADVLQDVIDHNESTGCVEEKRNKIKSLLRAYTGMTKPLRQELMDFGFEITEDGKHYKLVYHGDGRYSTALPKTPSESRGGKNAAAEIVGKML